MPAYSFIGAAPWLDFVNSDDAGGSGAGAPRVDALATFEGFVAWLEAAGLLDRERAGGLLRRGELQRAGATAVVVEARRVRAVLRLLAERGAQSDAVRREALATINRVLGRSAGMRRLERRADGAYVRSFVPTGDAFAGMMIPVADSAADALVDPSQLARVRRCAAPACARMFVDLTKNASRRWCDMRTCGNRAKARRRRSRS
jgi:predicted RNA-binding Zn ribbon-like protein